MWVGGRLELNDPPIAESGVNNEAAAEAKADLTTKARRHEYDWEKKQNETSLLVSCLCVFVVKVLLEYLGRDF